MSNNCAEKLSKEGILIDFENEVNHVSSTINLNDDSNKINSLTNPLNDLADIKFNTQEILNLYKQSDLKTNLPEKNDNITKNDLITTATTEATTIPCGSSTTFSTSTHTNATEKFRDEEEIPSSSFNSSGKSYYSKYYMPPYDNQSTSQYGKNRYYSSVCSNCDTMKNNYNNMVNENGASSCQCCYDLGYGSHAGHFVSDFVSTCFDNHNFFNDVCTTNYLHNDHTEKRFAPPIPYSTSTLSNVSTKGNINVNSNFNNDNHETKRSNFQTKICKDFIDELEANFSKIGQVKMNELSNDTNHNNTNNNSNSPVFPTINPPPKSYKTRRPAPPPPIQKKNAQ